MMYQESHTQAKVLFKITSECNQFCEYCSERPFIEVPRLPLTKEEIADNYNYLKERFTISSVILSGGEPTLHHEYFSILDFFLNKNIPLRMITNLLNFSDLGFLKRHKHYFRKAESWRIYGSLSTIPSGKSARNIQGLENIVKNKLPISLIIVVYKNNLRELPQLMKYLSELFVVSKITLNVELRLIYIEDVPYSVIAQAPDNFIKLAECVTMCLRLLSNINSRIAVWNFPLCYINDKYKDNNIDPNVEQRRNIRIIKINKDYQMGDFKVRDFRSFLFRDTDCVRCSYLRYCSGINKRYINDFGFPQLKPIVE